MAEKADGVAKLWIPCAKGIYNICAKKAQIKNQETNFYMMWKCETFHFRKNRNTLHCT